MSDPYVGILVNSHVLDRISKEARSAEELRGYAEACRRYGLQPCFIRLEDIDPEQREVNAFILKESRLAAACIPAPRVIYNRIHHGSPEDYWKLEDWCRDGKLVYNRWNGYGRQEIYDHLKEDANLLFHLPEQYGASPGNLLLIMRKHDKLRLIPDKGTAVAAEEMSLTRVSDGVWRWSYPVTSKTGQLVKNQWHFTESELPALLLHWLRREDFVVRKHMPLPEYRKRPWELHVCVQRGENGSWQLSGTAYRFTVPDAGSKKRPAPGLDTVLQGLATDRTAAEIKADIESFALRSARHLAGKLPQLADLGLRLALTPEGVLYWLDCFWNDPRKSFQQAGMNKEWKASFAKPMGYARYLLEQQAGVLT